MENISKVYLAFGSNLGNTEENIDNALKLLEEDEQINIIKVSSSWYTEPMGDKNQPWYLNKVALISCSNLSPYLLLEKTKKIEYIMGRERVEGNRNAARTLDIDILDIQDFTLASEELTIPHERMFERAFVLVPLAEIEPDYMYHNTSITTFLDNIEYTVEDNKIFQN